MKTLQLRHLPRESVVHRLRPETKLIALPVLSSTFIFNASWGAAGVGWGLAVVIFLLARLPRSVVAPPPRLFFYAVGFGALFSVASGGDPVVAGLELGGALDYLQLIAVGSLAIVYGAILAWTTEISAIGVGLSRLLRPLRFFRLPTDEIATVIMLAIRALPLVRDELFVTVDARNTRPRSEQSKGGFGDQIADGVDFGTTVLVGAHRRSREMAKAMVARGSVTAPEPLPQPWSWLNAAAVLFAVAVAVVVTLVF